MGKKVFYIRLERDTLPLIPPLKHKKKLCVVYMFERGSEFERGGAAPSLLFYPLQPKILWFTRL
jgi:hypothetical protein